jgi:secretion/DNA translocation related TadE-like protein
VTPDVLRRVRGAGRPLVRQTACDGGSATVWVLALCMVVWGVALCGTTLGAALVARHRAESAADLAALAAARATADGGGDPCALARRVAGAADALVVECVLAADGSVLVVAEVAMPGLVGHWPDLPPARARARAGGIWSVEERGAPSGPSP